MTDDTQPEAREFTMSQYASKDDMIGAMRKRIAELESELEAVGAGGVQALSAAPEAFLKSVIAPCSHRGYSPANIEARDKNDKWIADLWRQAEAMLAAPPTPPAEQAAPKAAPGEPVKQTVREQIAAEVATQPAAQVEFLARYLCERDSINPDQMLDDNPVRLAWHREDLNAARLLAKLAELAPQQEAQEPVAWLNPWRADQVTTDYDAYGERGIPLYTAPQPAPAPLSEMPYEKRKAIQEGEQIGASDAWFKARHEMLDTIDRRNVFRAGFDRGWNAALAAQRGNK